MDKNKIAFGLWGGIVAGTIYQEAVHITGVEMLTATRPSVHALPLYYPPHGNDPHDPSGPVREPWPTVAVTTSTASVSSALTPTVRGGST